MKFHAAFIQEELLLGGYHGIIYKNKPTDASSGTTIRCYKKIRDHVEFNVA